MKPQIGSGASNRLNATQTFRSASGLTYLREPCQFEGSWGFARDLHGDSASHATGTVTEDSERPLTEVMSSSGILPVSFRYPSGMRVKLQCHSGGFRGSLNGSHAPFRYPSGILPVSFRYAGLLICFE